MGKIVCAMMDLIASEVLGREFDKQSYALTDEEAEKLYELSKIHDMAHLTGNALIKNDLIGNCELKAKFQKQVMLAFFRSEKIAYESDRLKKFFNGEGIAFIPLKGAVIREYYPERWMRTSCDIDILVHENQVDDAAKALVDKLGYIYQKKHYHDISMMSDGGIHLELHFSIKGEKDNIDTLLANCWDYAFSDGDYAYRFGNEFFVFHQLAHAAYHFLSGGCGIRSILDIFLLEKKFPFDREILDAMLMKTEIKTFYEGLLQLAGVWFGGSEHNDITRRMERYVLSGGVFGNRENSIVLSQQSEKGQLGYILHRIWLPYESLCSAYPLLRGRRYLLPLYEGMRWLKIFNPEARRRKNRDLDIIKNLSTETMDEANRMMKELGLL